MSTVLQQARRYEDLLGAEGSDEAYAFETIFDATTWRARRLSKWRFKLLRAIDEKLRAMLFEGERVRYVTQGSSVTFWESYFLGWLMYYLNRRAIVLTDRRIIMLQIDARSRPSELVSQLKYTRIAQVGRSMFGNTKILLSSGRSLVFAYVPKTDAKVLQKLSDWVKTSAPHEGLNAGVQDLCPHCYCVVEGRPLACPTCRGTFRSTFRATLLSLAFPGLGDFYLGHRKLALMEIAFTGLIWTAMLLDPEVRSSPAGFVAVAAVLFLLIHVPDAITTRHIAKKGLYPLERAD